MSQHSNLNVYELTKKIVADIPESQRFTEADGDLILSYASALLSMEDDLVKGFYDTIEANPNLLALIGGHGARADREKTLRHWWQRTLAGPFDEKYWVWQAVVGIVHIRVGVKNPMMMGMWNWVVGFLRTRLTPEALGSAEKAAEAMAAVERLSLTVQAIISESFLSNYLETVIRITGFRPALLERMFKTEINVILAEAKGQLGTLS
jgi:hypothetical protein